MKAATFSLALLTVVGATSTSRTSSLLRSAESIKTTTGEKTKCAKWCAKQFVGKNVANVCKYFKKNIPACSGCEPCQSKEDVTVNASPEVKEVCTDTPGWTNGKKNKNCDFYNKKRCKDGTFRKGQKWSIGLQFNFPEQNCCSCGKPAEVVDTTKSTDKPADAEPAEGTCAKSNPCQNHGTCIDGASIGEMACECVDGFLGDHCEEERPPGEVLPCDPEKGRDVLNKAVVALNAARAKNSMDSIEIKQVVSYSTQQVAGTLHTFCFETIKHGFAQVVWDDFAHGAGPHVASVSPMRLEFKWMTEATSSFVCSVRPRPFDRRRSDFNTFLEENTSGIAEVEDLMGRLKDAVKVTEAVQEQATSSGLPKQWDARHDHELSPECKDLIETPTDQGTCGSCYAFAAINTASIRACLAGNKISNDGFSVQDVLNCGSVWEGEFQNNVRGSGLTGQTYADNCGGHWPQNVFEYATKYGLVDDACQQYAHSGDPLTHFDSDAGAKVCHLTNNGNSPMTDPQIDVFVPVDPSYTHFLEHDVMDGLFGTKDSGYGNQDKLHRVEPELAPDVRDVLNQLGLRYPVELLRYDHYYNLVRGYVEKEIARKQKLKRMKLSAPIPAKSTVSVDDMDWCKNRHPSNLHGMDNVKQKKDSEPHCLVHLHQDQTSGGKLRVSCSSNPDGGFVELEGPKGGIVGGVANMVCECPVDQLHYTKNGKQVHFTNANLPPSFLQLGNEARGVCHRSKSSGDFDFEGSDTSPTCGEVHHIFHSPVSVSGVTQSEVGMMRAIMEGGAISVGFSTTDSFMHYEGEPSVYAPKKDEKFDGGHAMTLFGWGEEKTGEKFWWVKNSWGKGPTNNFKFIRGNNACQIESWGASWVQADPPGEHKSDSLSLSSNNPNGFCKDSMVDTSMTAEKMKDSCVRLECKNEEDVQWCTLKYRCSKDKKLTTVVDIVSDGNYESIARTGNANVGVPVKSGCIENVRVEDRSA